MIRFNQLFFATILISTLVACGQSTTVKTLNQSDLSDKLSEKSVILIDVRTPEEVAQAYIPEAAHFLDINNGNFQEEVLKLDKNNTYVMYCRSGARSGRAATFMIQNGFKDVYNLEGGINNYTGQKKQK